MGGVFILHMWELSKIEVGIEERGTGVLVVSHFSSDFNKLSDLGFAVVLMSHLEMAEKGFVAKSRSAPTGKSQVHHWILPE